MNWIFVINWGEVLTWPRNHGGFVVFVWYLVRIWLFLRWSFVWNHYTEWTKVLRGLRYCSSRLAVKKCSLLLFEVGRELDLFSRLTVPFRIRWDHTSCGNENWIHSRNTEWYCQNLRKSHGTIAENENKVFTFNTNFQLQRRWSDQLTGETCSGILLTNISRLATTLKKKNTRYQFPDRSANFS
jgi:hypothetical protein